MKKEKKYPLSEAYEKANTKALVSTNGFGPLRLLSPEELRAEEKAHYEAKYGVMPSKEELEQLILSNVAEQSRKSLLFRLRYSRKRLPWYRLDKIFLVLKQEIKVRFMDDEKVIEIKAFLGVNIEALEEN